MKVFIDGKFYDEAKAKVSVLDHGLLYGDGVFEGIRAYNGRVFKLKEHIDRLFYSAKAILMTLPTPISVGSMPMQTLPRYIHRLTRWCSNSLLITTW